MDTLTLLSKMALSFQNFTYFNKEMNDILEDIGHVVDVSRIYIFLNEGVDLTSNKFEWCAAEITPQIGNLQKFAYKDIPSWLDLLMTKGLICSDDIMTLPADIIAGLKPQDIKSIIVYPLIIENNLAGFIGLDECRYHRAWKMEELKLLETISGIIANAYERKKIQQKLCESKNNFHAFFEAMEDMLIISDFNGNIINCNQSLIDKLGYSLAELKEMNILALHPENLREEASIIFDKMLNGETDSCPLQVCGKLGQVYLVETRIQIGKWNEEDCIFSISKDITGEHENLKLFSDVFEHNPLPMVISSGQDNKITRVNPACLEATGYSDADLIGKTTDALNLIIDSEKLDFFTDELTNHEKKNNQELLLKCKDGQLLNGLFSVKKIYTQGKQSYLTVIVDITERTALLKNIKDQCQKLTSIIEGSNLGTWEWNIQTDELVINKQWGELLGYSLDELQPINIETSFKLTHPKDLENLHKILEEHLGGEREYYTHDVRMKHKDGHWVWIQDIGRVTERDVSGHPLKMFGTHADITSKIQALEALTESEKRFFLALDETKAGLWDLDLTNNKLFLSSMWKQILGYKDHEIDNSIEAWQQLWHSDDASRVKKLANDYLSGKSNSFEVLNQMKHKDGSYRWILTRGGILRDEKGTPTRWIGTTIDITKEHEQALELERFFSVNLDLLCITDMEGNFIKTNKAWEDMLGYSSDELQKSNFLDFIHPDDLSKTLEAMKDLGNDKKILHFVNRYLSANGDYRHIEWRSNPYEGFIYAAARDITERIEYEQKILEISNRDALTNIYNRRYIYNRAEEIIEEYKRTGKIFSVCIIDIDHFKAINDNYGHSVGDSILKQFTKIIADNLRSYDLLGRYGGEEFILILNHATKMQSFLIIERVLDKARNKTFICNGNKIDLTFSAGISNCREIPKEDLIIYNLVELADKRMYQAKEMGRNQIIFNDSTDLPIATL